MICAPTSSTSRGHASASRSSTRGASFDDYQRTVLIRSAVESQFEIIGEALSQALRYHPTLADQINESGRIIAFRNQLAHGYSSIADDVVWFVVETSLPALRERVDALLLELDEGRQ